MITVFPLALFSFCSKGFSCQSVSFYFSLSLLYTFLTNPHSFLSRSVYRTAPNSWFTLFTSYPNTYTIFYPFLLLLSLFILYTLHISPEYFFIHFMCTKISFLHLYGFGTLTVAEGPFCWTLYLNRKIKIEYTTLENSTLSRKIEKNINITVVWRVK